MVKGNKKKKGFGLLKLLLTLLLMVVLVVAGYFAYVFLSYHRVEDNVVLTPSGNATDKMATGHEYTITTMNVGFGAYTPDFTFFMDGGTQGRASSKESVLDCINGAAQVVLAFHPDIAIFQEVDTDSDRSYHVDQTKLIEKAFDEAGNYDKVFAINFDSAYLFYPLTEPHGASKSGIYTLSAFDITSALRRSLPVATDFKKILDLDRAYSISRIPVDNGKELVLINTHLSAYGTDPNLINDQLLMMVSDMEAEYKKGNYVICGGDFNHDFTGDSKAKLNPGSTQDFDWCQPIPDGIIPEHFTCCTDYSEGLMASARNADIPYSEKNFTVVLDGFIISDNIDCTYVQVIDTGFKYSDHNPVVMRFELK